MRYAFFFLVILAGSVSLAQNIVINEACNNAFVSVEDSDGDFPNWVEIYNPLPVAVNLNQYYLSNAANDLWKYQCPDSILFPGEFALVLLSGKNSVDDAIHANFVWTNNQQRLYLSDINGQIVDDIQVPELPYDRSYGRETDGNPPFIVFASPSPGSSNNGRPAFVPQSENVSIWPPNGWYNTDSLRVEISSTNSGLTIRYTLDGSTPTVDAPVYDGAFWLKPNPTDTMYYALIPTTPASANSNWRWKEPKRMPAKNNVISVALFADSVRVSSVQHRHWFFGDNVPEQSEGVVSIISDPDGLFGFENGIFVPGITYANNPNEQWANGNYFNRGRLWERRSNLAFFEPDGNLGFSQDLGIRIHGFGSRGFALKSLRLYPRDIYGESRINYPIFPERDFDRYNRLLMRNGGQEFFRAVFIDGMVSEVGGKLNLEHQKIRPVTHYINGEYWGVLSFRDRLDEHFISYVTDTPEEDVFINKLTNGEWSEDDPRWTDFENRIQNVSNPNSQEALDIFRSTLDLDSYIDYFLLRVYVGVYDWPINNRMLWRTKSDTSLYRSVVIDNDGAFDNFEYNSLEHALNDEGFDWPNAAWSTMVFRQMMANNYIREKTIKRMENLITSTFHPDSLDAIISKYIERYEPLMGDHIDRWQYPFSDINRWKSELGRVAEFISKRPCYIRDFFRERFSLDGNYFNNFSCDGNGFIRKNNSYINFKVFPNPTSGTFEVDIEMERGQIYTITLVNMVGQTIYEETFYPGNRIFKHSIGSFNEQPSGSYVLRITSGHAVVHQRIVKY